MHSWMISIKKEADVSNSMFVRFTYEKLLGNKCQKILFALKQSRCGNLSCFHSSADENCNVEFRMI